MGVTAKARASVALTGTTALPPDQALNLIADTTQLIKGGGKSLLTTGVSNIGAQVNIVGKGDGFLDFSLTSGKKLVELCTFSAEVEVDGEGLTQVRVGGLETYKTSQSRLLFVIPTGPKMILGMDPYKRFLQACMEQIQAADPDAFLVVDQANG